MEKNDCYKCPYRRRIEGSAHFACHHPGVPLELRGEILMRSFFGDKPILKLDGEPVLEVNDDGFKMGWAYWPHNFDPVWITCKIPLE